MISEIHAAQAGTETLQNLTSFGTIGVMMIVFYFMMIRPQRQRQLAHEKTLSQLKVGDEVTTSSGILGKIINLDQQYVMISTDTQASLLMQRNAVMAILPNGTIKTRSGK